MAETSLCLKRPRAGEDYLHIQEEEEFKRHKSSSSSYNQILSFLEEDEEEPNQDLSSLITSFQQEISSKPSSESGSDPNNNFNHLTPSNSSQFSSKEDEDDKEGVIRHLLEASDDELGIPNTEKDEIHVGEDLFGVKFSGERGFEFSLCDDLWELEDNTATYYTLFQSDLLLYS